jgi:hypothetical protein
MAATCSESGLKAMSDAMQLPDRATIHTVDGHWMMQEFPVEVTHARQRSLTLLENHILKAFNHIQGCTARDIITQFGLDPLLVDSTLRTLKLCNTIDSVDEATTRSPIDDTLRTLNLELKTTLDRLAMVGGDPEDLRELQRQRDVTQQKIQQLESTMTPVDEDRFSRMKFQVNALGKEALLNKYMKEPTETKIYSFVRCMTTGVVHILGGPEIEKGAIEGGWPQQENSIWLSECNPKWSDVDPTRREIEDVLSSLDPNAEIEINTIEVLESRFEYREVHLPLHFTLTVGHEDKKQEWLVHLQREHIPRIRWIEVYLQQLNSQHPSLLKHLASSLPKTKGMNVTSVKNASPLVRLDRLIGQERTEQGILVVHEHEQLTNLINMPLQALDQLLTSRTIVCLSQKLKKNYDFQENNDLTPPSFTIPWNKIMPKGTIAMNSGFYEAGFISIFTSKEEIRLPVLCHSEPRGLKTVVKVDAYLRNLLSSEHLFLMTNAIVDLDQWIQEMVEGIASKKPDRIISDFTEVQNHLDSVVGPLGLDYMHKAIKVFVDRYATTCLNSNEGVKALLSAVEVSQISPDEKSDCWATIEKSIHALAVEESSSGQQNSDLFALWIAVRERKKSLPWEEMAHLEDTLVGNCTMTRFEVNRHTERIVKDLVVGNQRPVSDLAGMLRDLRSINVIDKKLHAELGKTKAGRNMFTHEYDMDADLSHTLEAIKTMRLLATLTDPIDDQRWETKEKYQNFSWNFSSQGIEQYLNQCLNLVDTFGRNHQFSQALWLDGLKTRLPVTYSQIPFNIAKTISEITGLKCGLNGDLITEKILKDSSIIWAESLEAPGNYSIPKNVLESMKELDGYGLQNEAKQIAEHILKEVPLSSTIETLLAEVNMAEKTMKATSPMNAIVRWKRTIEQPDFTIELQSLSNTEEDSLSRMGKTNTEKLFKGALEPYFGKNYTVVSMEKGITKIDEFISDNEAWLPVLENLENWIFSRCIRQLKQGTEDEMVTWLDRMTTTDLEKTSLKIFKKKLEEALNNLKKKIKNAKKAKAKSSKKSKKKKR